jgi:hypothetical protein
MAAVYHLQTSLKLSKPFTIRLVKFNPLISFCFGNIRESSGGHCRENLQKISGLLL